MTLAPTRPAAPASAAPTRFRPEIQGLRALAVALVVIYHVWLGRVSGGVDVFFLITGFLLTGQLLRAAERGPIRLGALWGRTAARLLPAATTVLLAVLAASAFLLPAGRWLQTLREVVASVLFLQNWQLAADSVDYTARNNTTSVVQHFWSLSLQVQIMIIWPVLVVLVVLLSPGSDLRERLMLTLGGLTVASLAFSIVLTAINQPLAYFHTLTRVWEFGLGGLLSLGIDRIVLARKWRVLLGWVGVLGLIACGMVLQAGAVFPGYAALWPTGCAAMVIIAGNTNNRYSADRLITSRPMQYLGNISYPLYLWHWPLLMFVLVRHGRQQIGLLWGLAVIVVAVLLAMLTHHFIERPSGGRVAVAGVAAVLIAAAGWYTFSVAQARAPGPADDRHPGALALVGVVDRPALAAALPPMVSVYDDWVDTSRWACVPMARSVEKVCTQPVGYPIQRRIMVVGDSHMEQFVGALEPLARHNGWQLSAMLLGGCPFSTVSEIAPGEPTCLAWNRAAVAEIAAARPDVVVTLGTHNVRVGLTEQTPPGFVAQWRALDELGIPVLAVRDNPRFASSPPDCLQGRGREADRCGVRRASVYSPEPPWTTAAGVPSNVAFLDTADLLCGPVTCPAEVGNVLVYMDDNHISATYASTMAPLIDQRVRGALHW